jgi:hypothetical protein
VRAILAERYSSRRVSVLQAWRTCGGPDAVGSSRAPERALDPKAARLELVALVRPPRIALGERREGERFRSAIPRGRHVYPPLSKTWLLEASPGLVEGGSLRITRKTAVFLPAPAIPHGSGIGTSCPRGVHKPGACEGVPRSRPSPSQRLGYDCPASIAADLLVVGKRPPAVSGLSEPGRCSASAPAQSPVTIPRTSRSNDSPHASGRSGQAPGLAPLGERLVRAQHVRGALLGAPGGRRPVLDAEAP